MTYIDWFLRLRCAGDVLNQTNLYNPVDDIEKTVAVFRHIRRLYKSGCTNFTIVNARNYLTALLTVHVLPVTVYTTPAHDFNGVYRLKAVSALPIINNSTLVSCDTRKDDIKAVLEEYKKDEYRHLVMLVQKSGVPAEPTVFKYDRLVDRTADYLDGFGSTTLVVDHNLPLMMDTLVLHRKA